MSLRNFLTLVALSFSLTTLLVACGGDCRTSAAQNRENGDAACGAQQDQASQPSAPTPSGFTIRGSIVSAFQVVVDGAPYQDIEAYYTAELAGLGNRVAAAGYTGYTAKLDATLGFLDLVTDMTVYIQTTSVRGYEGATTVGKDFTFALGLPADAAGDTYEIRANKRIGITLTKGNDSKKLCYNFSAINVDVPYALADKPVVMNTFQSEITSYACVQDTQPNQSLSIPRQSP